MRIVDVRGRAAEVVAKEIRSRGGLPPRVLEVAREIVDAVAREGDRAILRFSEEFDGVVPQRLLLERDDLEAAEARIPQELREALLFSHHQIARFHEAQRIPGFEVEIGSHGSKAGQRTIPLDRVGVYVPAGPRGYPSSALMGVVPAKLAGVREVLVATPPRRDIGLPPDAVLAAAAIAGADRLLVAGGAQAIAGMALGTETIPAVDKIVGPGNVYVSAAKLLVQDRVGTDGVAGPSELLLVADDSLTDSAVAAELLAQAEHDPEAKAVAAFLSPRDIPRLLQAIEDQARRLPRSSTILESLQRNGLLLQVDSREAAVEVANVLAPEHLVLAVRDAPSWLPLIRHAGCVLLGPATASPLSDYVAGPNHILPTGGTARWRGALGVADFVKPLTYVHVNPADLPALASSALRLAEAEGFLAHAGALASRLPAEEVGPP